MTPSFLTLGSLLAICLADRAGRRMLLIISGLGMGLSNLGLVLNQARLLNHSLMVNMLPVSALSAFYVFFTLGFGSLPFVILGEIFPVHSKGLAVSLSVSCIWCINFLHTKVEIV